MQDLQSNLDEQRKKNSALKSENESLSNQVNDSGNNFEKQKILIK